MLCAVVVERHDMAAVRQPVLSSFRRREEAVTNGVPRDADRHRALVEHRTAHPRNDFQVLFI